MAEYNYDRNIRYLERIIKKVCETLKESLLKPPTAANVNEGRFPMEELTHKFDRFYNYTQHRFKLIYTSAKEEDMIKHETQIMNNLEVVCKLTQLHFTRAKIYISDFETLKTHELIANNSFNGRFNLNKVNVKFPHIEISKFNGNIENFMEFSILFENVIYKERSISKVRKLHYLNQVLEGRPVNLLKNIPLTQRGYDETWGLILSKYRDVKGIV